jgi:cytochrome c biogenesis protein CcdA
MNESSSNETTTRAVLSLVFGVLAMSGGCPCIGGILAIVFGMGEKSGVGRAGLILGWIHLALIALIFVAVACFVGVAAFVDAVN